MDSQSTAGPFAALEADNMELLMFFAVSFGALFVILAISQISSELRGMRSLLETQYQLERVPIKSESPYKRKGVEL
jgi:hypothetical protein